MILSLYDCGMTIGDILHHLAGTLQAGLSPEAISNNTDAVLEEVKS